MRNARAALALASSLGVVIAGCGEGGGRDAPPTARAAVPTTSVHPLGEAGSGTFGQPVAVSPQGVDIKDEASVAVNSAGRIVAAWTASVASGGGQRGYRTQVRIGGMDGRFGPTVSLGGSALPGSQGPGVASAIGADGTVAVLWIERGARVPQLRLALKAPAAATFARPVTIGVGHGIQLAGLVVASDGRVTAAWQTGFAGGAVHVVTGHGDQYRPLPIVPRRVHSYGAASLATTADGVQILTYETATFNAVVIQPDQSRAQHTIPLVEGAAFGGSGGIAIAGNDGTDLHVMPLSAAGSLLPSRRVGRWLGETPSLVRATVGPIIALPPDRSLSAVWEVHTALSGDNDDDIVAARIMVASASRGGGFGTEQRLSTRGRLGEHPSIAAVGDTTVAIWTERTHGDPESIAFRIRRPGRRRFGRLHEIATRTPGIPTLTASGRHLVAAWQGPNRRSRLTLALWREPR